MWRVRHSVACRGKYVYGKLLDKGAHACTRCGVSYGGRRAETKHGRVSSQLIDLLTRIFSCGNMTAKEFKEMGVTVENLIGCPWFQQDLPTGALDMRERCLEQTRARVASTDYEHVREYLLLAAQEYLASTAAASPPGRVPSGAGWLPEVPAAKQQPPGMAIADWMAGFTEDAEPASESIGAHGKSIGCAEARTGFNAWAAVKHNVVVNGGHGSGIDVAGADGGFGAGDMGDGGDGGDGGD